jgi:hypothetical protein
VESCLVRDCRGRDRFTLASDGDGGTVVGLITPCRVQTRLIDAAKELLCSSTNQSSGPS